MKELKMIKKLLGLALFGMIVGMVSNASQAADDTEWTQLFNGKDLTGWKLHPDADKKTKWEVVDGWLTGSGNASMLYSEGDNYTDFHYRVTAKISDGGNSGQYFRAQFVPGFQTGYEAQLNATHRDPIKTGSLYIRGKPELHVLNVAPHKPNEEFVQEVIAKGNHIQIFVNGKKTVDYTDPDSKHLKGHFAIQQHDPGSKIQIKKIEIKEIK
jgi:hypothetical protein